MNKHLE